MADTVTKALDLAERLPAQDAKLVRMLVAGYTETLIAKQAASDLAQAILLTKRERDKALQEAERLQKVLDSRPPINEALPQSYILWSNAIREMEQSRADDTQH